MISRSKLIEEVKKSVQKQRQILGQLFGKIKPHGEFRLRDLCESLYGDKSDDYTFDDVTSSISGEYDIYL